MTRILTLALSLLTFISSPAWAETETTSDPNHKGYQEQKYRHDNGAHEVVFFGAVQWNDIKTECKPCEPLVKQYNKVVQGLFEARTLLKRLEFDTSREGSANLKYDLETMGKDNSIEAEGFKLGSVLESIDAANAALPAQRQLVTNYEILEEELKGQIGECEKQCTSPDQPQNITINNAKALVLPYDWKGPYTTQCFKCEKLVTHLNGLPATTYPLLAEKLALQMQIELHETWLKIHFASTYARYMDAETLRHSKEAVSEGKAELKEVERKLGVITKNFEDTIKLLEGCEKECSASAPPPAAAPSEGACSMPTEYPAITIGPNDQYGSSAAMTNEIKDKAKGMAMGALGGALGGGGFSLGGGGRDDSIGSPGGDSSQKGPKTDKDPTKGDYTTISAGGTNLEIRTGWDDGNFVVSTNIEDSPGDGTFHAQWIEGADGKRYLPIRYLIIALYRDWKLSVWWDYKRWRDGELVEHKSGDSMTVGRDHLGTWTIFEGAKGVANSIWNSLGFATAKKGVQNLGAVFDLPVAALSGPCPARLITHISLPSEDPVSTMPVVGELFRSAPEDKKNLSVIVRPAIISGAE